MAKKTYAIKGMHCASCATIIEKKLSATEGISNAVVNFATEKASVVFDEQKVSVADMNKHIKPLGYSLHDPLMHHEEHENHLMHNHAEDFTKNKILFAFISALLVFLLMLWGILRTFLSFLPEIPIPMETLNVILLVLSTIVLFWVGRPFLLGVLRFIRFRVANMDTLVGIGTGSAYLYSAFLTLFPAVREIMKLPEATYFDVVIVVVGFVVFGKYLESSSKKKTGAAIEKLLNLQAKTAFVLRENQEIEIPLHEVLVGDVVFVKPGGKVPVDGIILEGKSSLDESMISGEPIPLDKGAGEIVIGGTINKQGYLKIKATKIGSETMLAQIIHMVEEAQGSKAPIQALADKISGIFVPVVLVIALVSLLSWLFIGIPLLGQSQAISYGLLSFVGVLVIACPCALGLATPTAIIVGVGKGAQKGILVKNAESLEILGTVDTVVFDKTGTITKGKPVVTDIIVFKKDLNEIDFLTLVGSAEKMSEHPLAEAIVAHALSKNISLLPGENFSSHEGMGIEAIVNKKNIFIHKPEKNNTHEEIKKLQEEGKTVIIVEENGEEIGILALSDVLKPEAKVIVAELLKQKINVVMITGDNHRAAITIAHQAGIQTVFSEVLPNEKAGKIKELQEAGRIVAMVGDGINDAPALMQSNVGIAMATGTDVAIESAGITLLRGDIHKVLTAIQLSRKTIQTVRQNLFWAFLYNIIGIPLASGIFFPFFGWFLNPVFAGAAMAFSSISVVGNSLRLKMKKI